MDTASQSLGKIIRRPTLWLVVILFLGTLLRLYDITDEPLELHPTRQFRALIISRALYYPTTDQIPAEHLDFAEQQAAIVGFIEPSILEFLTAQLYRLAGQEITWLGRVIPITAWVLGGLALYSLARQLGSTLGAFLSVTYYLFLPLGVSFSRVLIVDPIMVAMSVISLWALFTWQQRRDFKFALLTGLLTGLTILLKSVAGIILIIPFALFILSAEPVKSAIKNRQIWLILLLAALPSALYYYYGIVIDGRLAAQFKGRFFPEIWADLIFYKSWGLRIIREFNIFAFAAGLMGIYYAKSKPARRILFGWWAGYFIYAILFAYHTWTHDYYHLPMVPLLAVSIAPTAAFLEQKIAGSKFKTVGLTALVLLFLGIITAGSFQTIQFLSNTDHRHTRMELESLGKIIKDLPEGRIIGLSDDYETSFTFYNFLRAEHWPTLGDMNFRELQGGEEQAFEQLWQITEDAAYFVVSDFAQLEKQPILEQRLSGFPILYESDSIRLYTIGMPSP
ncbi:MAG: glycosyltransferase family 39 protein [Chloroflexota bacterium]